MHIHTVTIAYIQCKSEDMNNIIEAARILFVIIFILLLDVNTDVYIGT